MGDYVYTFCGFSATRACNISSIERVNAREALSAPILVSGQKWHLLELAPGSIDFEACCNPLVAPISPNELVILGGDNFATMRLGDGFVFNVSNQSLERVLENNQYRFTSARN